MTAPELPPAETTCNESETYIIPGYHLVISAAGGAIGAAVVASVFDVSDGLAAWTTGVALFVTTFIAWGAFADDLNRPGLLRAAVKKANAPLWQIYFAGVSFGVGVIGLVVR